MIVVDTNVIAYFVIPGDETELAEAVWAKDSTWAAPSLWRSEMRNLLSLYVKREKFDLLDANEFIADATNLLEGMSLELNHTVSSNLHRDRAAQRTIANSFRLPSGLACR